MNVLLYVWLLFSNYNIQSILLILKEVNEIVRVKSLHF